MPVAKLVEIPIELPRERIFSRLGYNKHLTVVGKDQAAEIEKAIQAGFACCHVRGVYARISISERTPEKIILSNGNVFESASLAKMLGESSEVLLLATTVGKDIMTAIKDALENGSATWASVLDATGSETVDAALEWLQHYVASNIRREGAAVTRQRFSPGYGDLGLENQRTIYEILKLEQIGVELTERLLLVPEKSVIGIAGIF